MSFSALPTRDNNFIVPAQGGGTEIIMKRILCVIFALTFCLCGCGRKTPIDGNTSSDVEENISSEETEALKTEVKSNEEIASKGEKKADSGVKVIVENGDTAAEGSPLKTVLNYYYKKDKVVSVKTVNTYKNEEEAEKARAAFEELPGSCTEVKRDGCDVSFYAAKGAFSVSNGKTKDEIKEMAQEIGAKYEEF